MADHEGEQTQVALGVSGDQVEALEVEQSQIAVVVLHALAHQIGTDIGFEGEVPPLGGEPTSLGFDEVQERLLTTGALAVRPAAELDLHQSQVDPHLKLLPAVVPGNDPHLHVARLEVPAGQDRGDVLAQDDPLGSFRAGGCEVRGERGA